MARHRQRTVFGERAELIGQALAVLGLEQDGDGGAARASLTAAQSGALERALLRAEAKVLHGDADRLRRGQSLARDDGDRPFVALLLVMQRAKDAQRG